MNNKNKNSLVWLRRDLRLYDHNALYQALKKSNAVYCCFIFDTEILKNLSNKNDRRIDFIWNSLKEIKKNLNKLGSDLIVEIGDPVSIIPSLIEKYKCDALFLNKDYEQYAISRDNKVAEKLKKEKGAIKTLSIGSSLKFCLVAEGSADIYPRFSPTMEWDTGAGHAIAKYAGFSVKQYNSSEDVVYNKENLLNPWFLVK